MNPLIQLKKPTPVFFVALVCFGLLPTMQAVSQQVFDNGMLQWSVTYENTDAILTGPNTILDQGSKFLLLMLGLLGLVMYRRQFRRMLGRLLVAPFLVLFLFLPGRALAAPLLESREPLSKNAWDIAVIDQVLATVKPSQKMVPFGDVGIKPEDLKMFRQRLVEEQGSPSPSAVTPPGTAFKWPTGIVPYRFDPTQVSNGTITAAKMQQFRDGVAEWAAFANLHFNEFTGTPPLNFVTVQEQAGSEGGFSSSVGMAGGEQFVQFGPNSWNRGTVCHEVGHAIGLYHEQQRDDRDTYVVILWQNIISGTEPNFAKLPGGSVAQGAYDFYSIMHYARNALSRDPNNLNTIEPQPAYSQFLNIMGQVYYRTLSKLDRAGMALVYGNPSPLPSAVVTNTNDSGSGSLRAAIYYAFDKSTDVPPVPTPVVFNIPTSDPGFANNVFTIKPTYLLVAPGAGTTIDGATQTAFTGNTNPYGPEVVLDGSQIAVQNLFAPGFDLREANCAVKNLVISGFNQQGILLEGAGATGNIVSGCYIGTDPTGTSAIPNTFPGVEIIGGANGNTIGGTTVAARNVISGNAHLGVSIHYSGTHGNVVLGNYIGLNATGTAAIPNTYAGVEIFGGAINNTIGSGTNTGGRNIISGNSAQGITIADAGSNLNKVPGNIIGLNPAGTAAIGNQFEGIAIFGGASSNTIGGTSSASINFISGNVGSGISISGVGTKSNKVQHNFIGAQLNGTAAAPNNAGVQIFGGAANNTIGGTTVSVRNIISGNNFQGVAISGSGTKSNTVAGNFIGTNNVGTAALPNTAAGVSIFLGAQSNVIGGSTAASRNVISGNLNQGVTVSDSGTKLNQIMSNYIGLNAAGTAALANSWSGIDIFTGAASNIIGAVGKGNVISGNGNYGIAISGAGTSLHTVQGNLIGLNAAGTAGIGNAFAGVTLFGGAQSNTIGGTTAGAGNVIFNNTFEGIVLFDTATTHNSFRRNSINNNGDLGIRLSTAGGGMPNGLQAAPHLTTAVRGVNNITIVGTLNSTANQNFQIEFFSSPTADPSGFGEGQTFLGSTQVTTDSFGAASFSTIVPVTVPAGNVVSSTATSPLGSTSQFSNDVTAQ